MNPIIQSSQEYEGQRWLAECVFDLYAKLGLSSWQVLYILAGQLRRVIDKALYNEGGLGD